MKRNIMRFVILLFSLLPFTFATAAPVNYTLDPTHSAVLWHINHFGFSNPSGKWMAEGTLVLDEKKPQDSKVNVVIHTADITTGIPKLDKHLREAAFFDADKFPTATFVSNKVKVINKKTAKVHGILTLRGVSKPVILNVTLNKIGMNSINNKITAGFSATAEIKRSDFGMTTYLPGLSDKVKLNIEVEAHQ